MGGGEKERVHNPQHAVVKHWLCAGIAIGPTYDTYAH